MNKNVFKKNGQYFLIGLIVFGALIYGNARCAQKAKDQIASSAKTKMKETLTPYRIMPSNFR